MQCGEMGVDPWLCCRVGYGHLATDVTKQRCSDGDDDRKDANEFVPEIEFGGHGRCTCDAGHPRHAQGLGDAAESRLAAVENRLADFETD